MCTDINIVEIYRQHFSFRLPSDILPTRFDVSWKLIKLVKFLFLLFRFCFVVSLPLLGE